MAILLLQTKLHQFKKNSLAITQRKVRWNEIIAFNIMKDYNFYIMGRKSDVFL